MVEPTRLTKASGDADISAITHLMVGASWDDGTAMRGGADYPTLCHQCAGGGRSSSQSLEISDEWEVSRFEGKPIVTTLDGDDIGE